MDLPRQRKLGGATLAKIYFSGDCSASLWFERASVVSVILILSGLVGSVNAKASLFLAASGESLRLAMSSFVMGEKRRAFSRSL